MRDWLHVALCGAGRGAQDRFDELAARWRKRQLGRLRVFTSVLLTGLVVGALFERHYVALVLGSAIGSVVALFLSIRDEVPAHIEVWRTGYVGERKTATVLAPFRRRGCVPLHDLPDRRTERYTTGNIDHVLVAPWGVYLLDSKNLGGSVTVDGDAVHVQRLDDETDGYTQNRFARGMRGKAVRLKEDIQTAAGVILRVHAVVVLWCPFEAGIVVSKDVAYVHGDRLVEWLEKCRLETPDERLMGSETVERIAAGLDRARPREARPWLRRLGVRADLHWHRRNRRADEADGVSPAAARAFDEPQKTSRPLPGYPAGGHG